MSNFRPKKDSRTDSNLLFIMYNKVTIKMNKFKSILKKITEPTNTAGIIYIALFCFFIFYIAKSIVERISKSTYQEVFYVYACPEKLKGGSCFKLKADYIPSKWNGDDYEQEYFDKIYFDNGSSIEFSSCSISDKTYFCSPVNKDDGDWKLQISEVKKIKK